MKFVLVFLFFFIWGFVWAFAWAAPVDEPVKITEYEVVQNPEGSYLFGFKSTDGVSRSEKGQLKEALDEDNKPHTVVVVRGVYEYPDGNGGVERITYVADENGFQPKGDSIPTVPSRR